MITSESIPHLSLPPSLSLLSLLSSILDSIFLLTWLLVYLSNFQSLQNRMKILTKKRKNCFRWVFGFSHKYLKTHLAHHFKVAFVTQYYSPGIATWAPAVSGTELSLQLKNEKRQLRALWAQGLLLHVHLCLNLPLNS